MAEYFRYSGVSTYIVMSDKMFTPEEQIPMPPLWLNFKKWGTEIYSQELAVLVILGDHMGLIDGVIATVLLSSPEATHAEWYVDGAGKG